MTARKPVFSNRTDRFRAIIRHVSLFFPPPERGAYGSKDVRKGWRGRSVIRYDDGCAKGCIGEWERRGGGGRAKGFFFRGGQSYANLECVRPIIDALGAFLVMVGRGSCVLRDTISLRHSDIRSVSVLRRGFLASAALGSRIVNISSPDWYRQWRVF